MMTMMVRFVILHGTDTLAYTSSALSFMLENLGKPVIVTGFWWWWWSDWWWWCWLWCFLENIDKSIIVTGCHHIDEDNVCVVFYTWSHEDYVRWSHEDYVDVMTTILNSWKLCWSHEDYAYHVMNMKNDNIMDPGSQIPAFETRSDGRENLVRFSFSLHFRSSINHVFKFIASCY